MATEDSMPSSAVAIPSSVANDGTDSRGAKHESNDENKRDDLVASDQTPESVKTTGAVAERQPTFKDFVRVFSYAKKIDWFLMVAACVSSIGSGIVRHLLPSPPCLYLQKATWLTLTLLDPTTYERRFWQAGRKLQHLIG